MTNLENDMELKIENVVAGLRNYGYRVLCRPVAGSEQDYYEALSACLRRADRAMEYVHKHYRCRGLSKRAIAELHRALPEPGWGVKAP